MTFLLLLSFTLTCTTYYYYQAYHSLQIAQKAYEQNEEHLVMSLYLMTEELNLVAYPNSCTAKQEQVLGEQCDLGNYMEWILPQLHTQTQNMLNHLQTHK